MADPRLPIINHRPNFLLGTGVRLWQAAECFFNAIIGPAALQGQQGAGFMIGAQFSHKIDFLYRRGHSGIAVGRAKFGNKSVGQHCGYIIFVLWPRRRHTDQSRKPKRGHPQKPVAAVVGGAKVSTKLELLANLVEKVEHLIIGGGMANTFLAAEGYGVGNSLAEHDMTDTARAILKKAELVGCDIILPNDIVVAQEFKAHAAFSIHPADACPKDGMILDAGPLTIQRIEMVLEAARTLIWNGPLGAFEIEPFDAATNSAARKAAELTVKCGLVSVAGGGDTVAALNKSGAAEDFSYVSTAGGAFLEWMEGKTLPGVAALNSN